MVLGLYWRSCLFTGGSGLILAMTCVAVGSMRRGVSSILLGMAEFVRPSFGAVVGSATRSIFGSPVLVASGSVAGGSYSGVMLHSPGTNGVDILLYFRNVSSGGAPTFTEAGAHHRIKPRETLLLYVNENVEVWALDAPGALGALSVNATFLS